MNQKLDQIRKRSLNEAKARHDEQCRDFIIAIRTLPKPLTFGRILDHLLKDVNADSFTDAAHNPYVRAHIDPILSSCLSLGWLCAVSRKQPMTFDLSDEFELVPGAYTVKKRVVKKQVTAPGTATIVVYESEYGLEVRRGDARTDLTDSDFILFTALWNAHQNRKVVTEVPYKDDNLSLPMAILRLRSQIATDLGLDRKLLKKGICSVPGKGYRLNTNVLKVVWRNGPSRQRGVISQKSL